MQFCKINSLLDIGLVFVVLVSNVIIDDPAKFLKFQSLEIVSKTWLFSDSSL